MIGIIYKIEKKKVNKLTVHIRWKIYNFSTK